MAKFYTADQHFNHKAMLYEDGPNRPFKNVWQMNAFMVEGWNSVVTPGDIVYVAGDLAFPNKGDGSPVEKILERLNGQIILIAGNHDWKNMELFKNHRKIQKIVDIEYTKDVLINGEKQKIMICHYPMLTWRASVHGSWHLHGHSHGHLLDQWGKRIDVGVDTRKDMSPYSFQEIEAIMDTLPVNLDYRKKEIKNE